MSSETWRVVLTDCVREVCVEAHEALGARGWQYRINGVFLVAASARIAVARWCVMGTLNWPVVEIVAPGALTAAERVAAETDRCVRECRVVADRYGAERPDGSEAADDCADAIGGGA